MTVKVQNQADRLLIYCVENAHAVICGGSCNDDIRVDIHSTEFRFLPLVLCSDKGFFSSEEHVLFFSSAYIVIGNFTGCIGVLHRNYRRRVHNELNGNRHILGQRKGVGSVFRNGNSLIVHLQGSQNIALIGGHSHSDFGAGFDQTGMRSSDSTVFGFRNGDHLLCGGFHSQCTNGGTIKSRGLTNRHFREVAVCIAQNDKAFRGVSVIGAAGNRSNTHAIAGDSSIVSSRVNHSVNSIDLTGRADTDHTGSRRVNLNATGQVVINSTVSGTDTTREGENVLIAIGLIQFPGTAIQRNSTCSGSNRKDVTVDILIQCCLAGSRCISGHINIVNGNGGSRCHLGKNHGIVRIPCDCTVLRAVCILAVNGHSIGSGTLIQVDQTSGGSLSLQSLPCGNGITVQVQGQAAAVGAVNVAGSIENAASGAIQGLIGNGDIGVEVNSTGLCIIPFFNSSSKSLFNRSVDLILHIIGLCRRVCIEDFFSAVNRGVTGNLNRSLCHCEAGHHCKNHAQHQKQGEDFFHTSHVKNLLVHKFYEAYPTHA